MILTVVWHNSSVSAAPKRALLQEDVGMVNPLQYGSSLNSTTLSSAVTAIGSDSRILFLSTGTWTISSNVTIPSNITLWIPRGANIVFSGGAVLTLNTRPLIDYEPWYSGTGSVVISPPDILGSALSAFVKSDCLPAVPSPASLTLDAITCTAVVIGPEGNAQMVKQSSAAIGPLNLGSGTYWIGMHWATSGTVSGWTRQGSTRYLWMKSSTEPNAPSNGLLIARVTVDATPVITVVDDYRLPRSYVYTGRFDVTDPLYGADPSKVNDSTTAIQTAINRAGIGGHVHIPQGNYIMGNITLPAALTLTCDSRQSTNLWAKSGTTGNWVTDQGNAAKITILGCAFYGNDEAGITRGLYLGATIQFGTEGMLRDLWVRDLPNATCVDIDANVGAINSITTQDCNIGLKLLGDGNYATNLLAVAPIATGLYVGGWKIDGYECEAPATNAECIYLFRDSIVTGIITSLATGITVQQLVEIDAGATEWTLGWLNHYMSGTATIAVANIYDNGTSSGFGGLATVAGGNTLRSHTFQARVSVVKGFQVKNQLLQGFAFELNNNGGTLEHKIGADVAASGATGNFVSAISGANGVSYTTTPTGADASTAFAAGAKVSSAATNTVIFNTATQIQADALFLSSFEFNSSTVALSVIPSFTTFNVNGVSRKYFCLNFYNATTGVAYPLSTLGSGTKIRVRTLAFVAP